MLLVAMVKIAFSVQVVLDIDVDDHNWSTNIVINGVSYDLKLSESTAQTLSDQADASIFLYPPSLAEVGDDWILAVDDYVLRYSDFEESYKQMESQISQLIVQYYDIVPTESQMKEIYLEQLVPAYVLAIKALDEGLMQDEENLKMLKDTIFQSLGTLYLEYILPTDEDYFKPTATEIEKYYLLYKDQFLEYKNSYGLTTVELKELIIDQIEQQKLQQWQEEIVNEVKEEYSIKKNTEILIELGIEDRADIDSEFDLENLDLPDLE